MSHGPARRLAPRRRRRPAFADLGAYLAPRLRQDAGKPVLVRTHPAAPYRVTADVLDELRQLPARLGLPGETAIAIPTRREIELYWPAGARDGG